MRTCKAMEQGFRRLISGEAQGPLPAISRCGLALMAGPYAAAIRWRNWQYDRRAELTLRVPVPVISVGNLTTGGTGKTPLICAVAHWFRQRDVRVSIVSRGYKLDERTGRNDEALELERRLPDVPHVQNPDRVAGARLAIDELAAQLILLDDGFQHRRIARNLDIVVIDGLQPFGYDHLLPRGLLREPISALRRADLIVLSRGNLIGAEQRESIRRRVQHVTGARPWVEIAQRPQCWLSADGSQLPLAALHHERIVAFCGLGNPEGFARTLQELELPVAHLQIFPDHHHYTREELLALTAYAKSLNATAMVCTHKDLVKVNAIRLDNLPVYALLIDVELLSGAEAWEAKLSEVLRLIPADDL